MLGLHRIANKMVNFLLYINKFFVWSQIFIIKFNNFKDRHLKYRSNKNFINNSNIQLNESIPSDCLTKRTSTNSYASVKHRTHTNRIIDPFTQSVNDLKNENTFRLSPTSLTSSSTNKGFRNRTFDEMSASNHQIE